jgi:ribonuclease HI
MLVTILTDASWCPDTGAAGYGYWIASGRGKRPGGNVMKPAVNPCHAEMMAIANGLTVALKAELVCDGDDVLIQTDSTNAIRALTSQELRYGDQFTLDMAAVRDYVTNLVARHKLRMEYRHVKGHSPRPEARFKANNHCDERAKLHMRRARRRIREMQSATVPQD